MASTTPEGVNLMFRNHALTLVALAAVGAYAAPAAAAPSAAAAVEVAAVVDQPLDSRGEATGAEGEDSLQVYMYLVGEAVPLTLDLSALGPRAGDHLVHDLSGDDRRFIDMSELDPSGRSAPALQVEGFELGEAPGAVTIWGVDADGYAVEVHSWVADGKVRGSYSWTQDGKVRGQYW